MAEPTTYLFVLPWEGLPWEPGSAGGVNEVVRNLLRCVATDGHWQPALLASSWAHRRPLTLQDQPVLTIRSRIQNPFWHIGSLGDFVKSALAAPRALWQLRRIVSRHRVAVVNLHYANSNVWSFILLRRLLGQRFRLIVSFHGLDVEAIRTASPGERRSWSRALADCDALVCCSQALGQELVEAEPAARDRLAVIHNGIDVPATLREVESAKLPLALARRPYVACVATFEHKKGLDVLVRAFALLAAKLPGIDLVLAGRAGSEQAVIAALVTELALGDRVHLLVDVPHPVALRIIQNARAFVLPSRREPFGLVLLEAAVLGVPLVATTVGGIPEVVIDGQTGRLVPPDDPQALAAAIERALGEEVASRRLAEAMRERTRQRFSWDAAYARYRMLATGEAGAQWSVPD